MFLSWFKANEILQPSGQRNWRQRFCANKFLVDVVSSQQENAAGQQRIASLKDNVRSRTAKRHAASSIAAMAVVADDDDDEDDNEEDQDDEIAIADSI